MPINNQVPLLIPVESADHAQGPDDAPITLVEYGDYECPYCGKASPILKQLRKTMEQHVRLVFRHFPLNSVHPHASVAAQAAEAAGAQQKFWDMHDMLFAHQDDLAGADLVQYALRIGLEIYRFEADLASERFARHIQRDYEGGVRTGVNKTPTLFINDFRYDGPLEFEAILSAVKSVKKD